MLLQKIINLNGFSSHIYSISSKLLENQSLLNIISLFFKDLIPNRKYFILLRLKFKETQSIVTLHKGLIIHKDQKDKYFEYCKDILSIKSNDYIDSYFDEIIFDYFIIDSDKEKYYIDKWSEIKSERIVKLEKFTNSTISLFLPLNRDYLTWGEIIVLHLNLYSNGDLLYKINIINSNLSKIIVYKGKNIIFIFNDVSYNNNIFIRSYNNQKYYINFLESKIVLSTKQLKTKYLSKLNHSNHKNLRIITIDIETLNKDGVLTPYLYSMYDGVKAYSFFSESPEPLFNQLLKRKYRGYTVYALKSF